MMFCGCHGKRFSIRCVDGRIRIPGAYPESGDFRASFGRVCGGPDHHPDIAMERVFDSGSSGIDVGCHDPAKLLGRLVVSRIDSGSASGLAWSRACFVSANWMFGSGQVAGVSD